MTNGLISRLREFFHRLRSLFRAKQIDAELDAEMAAHLELAMEENLRRGLAPGADSLWRYAAGQGTASRGARVADSR
jgi:hypothetical protein